MYSDCTLLPKTHPTNQEQMSETKFEIVRPVFPKLSEFEREFSEALRTGAVTNQSKYVVEFERELAKYVGVKYCAVFCNGEQALIAMLYAANLKGEVIVPAYTYSGTIHAVAWNKGLTPVFADIDEKTLTIDPKDVAKRITKKTVAILAAPFYGNPCDNDALQKLADKHHIRLFYDSASGCGSRYRGKMVGSFGDAEMFSFHATKVFTTMEGGAVLTNDKKLYEVVTSLRNFGKNYKDADCDYPGFNGKMTEVCALVGLKLLPSLDKTVLHRDAIASHYIKRLGHIKGFRIQQVQKNSLSSWLYFQFEVDKVQCGMSRDELILELEARKITGRRFNFPPNHLLTCYKTTKTVRLPVAERVSANSIALPVYSDMTFDEASLISDAVIEVLSKKKKTTKGTPRD